MHGVLVKMCESCIATTLPRHILRAVEPNNLGLGSPDAAAMCARFLREWSTPIAQNVGKETPGATSGAPEALVALDLENAYGRAFRSTCLEV